MSGVDRRTLLLGSAAMAAGRLLAQEPAGAAAQPVPRKRTLKKAVMIGMVNEGKTLLEKFTILKECGFQGAELDSPSDQKPEDVLEAIEKTGVAVHGLVDSVHWRLPLSHASQEVRGKARQALETALRDAKRYGSTSILLVPAIVDAKTSYADAWTRSLAELQKVLPLAAECNVKIGIENVWNNFLLSPLEAARYVDELKSEWVGWHFDVGNVIHYGWPEQWVQILGKRICKLHIKEYSRKKSDAEGKWKGFSVELLEGDNGWPLVMRALDEIGFSTAPAGNWATAEVGGGDHKRLAAIATKMDQIFAL